MGFWKYVLGTPRNYALTFNVTYLYKYKTFIPSAYQIYIKTGTDAL